MTEDIPRNEIAVSTRMEPRKVAFRVMELVDGVAVKDHVVDFVSVGAPASYVALRAIIETNMLLARRGQYVTAVPSMRRRDRHHGESESTTVTIISTWLRELK